MDLEGYLNLLPRQHRRRPRYLATATALLRPLCGLEAVLEELRQGFDLDSAQGLQLDGLGERLGLGRQLSVPLEGVYFSLDLPGCGLDEGVWKGPFDPEQGLVTLPDDLYRILLKAKAAANAWDGTIPGAYAVWQAAFADSGSLMVIQDNQDMSMVIGITGLGWNPVLRELMLHDPFKLKPHGVRIAWYGLVSQGPIFALDADSPALAGLDKGSWAEVIIPEQA